MKKIISGRLYNTETAKELNYYDNGLSTANERYFVETLYIKKNGEYFLYGYGGALSPWREPLDFGWIRGENIIPLTEDEAKQWAEEKLDADEYMELFGEPEE